MLSGPGPRSCNLCQSSDNTAFKKSIKFWKSIKRLPVFTSATFNSKRSALFSSHFFFCSNLAIFLPGLSFCCILAIKIGKVLKLSLIWCRAQEDSLRLYFYWEYYSMNNWFMKLPSFLTTPTWLFLLFSTLWANIRL